MLDIEHVVILQVNRIRWCTLALDEFVGDPPSNLHGAARASAGASSD